jgi:hypothetical protein
LNMILSFTKPHRVINPVGDKIYLIFIFTLVTALARRWGES